MTEDQIKAIAEEYAEYYAPTDFRPDVSYTQLFTDATRMLDFISKNYCIVEREKVMEEYEEACDEIDFETETKSVLHQNVALGRKVLIESLFGTSMFNQNEDNGSNN